MREIKFRMWNESNSSRFFYDTDNVMECLKQQIIFNANSLDKMGYNHTGNGNYFEQFTGLKDKNGKDIYEGSIFKCLDGKNRELIYANGCFGFEGTISTVVHQGSFELSQEEIIGNIHENPELL